MKKNLEDFSFFPAIAWTVVVGFALFTYMLASELQTITHPVEQNTVMTNAALTDASL